MSMHVRPPWFNEEPATPVLPSSARTSFNGEDNVFHVEDNSSVDRTVSLRVLVVDDNEDAAESLALFLTLSGHEVRTAGDGLQAVQAARVFRPDAMVIDLGLPGMNGCDVVRLLRGEPDLSDIVMVALTGHGGETHRRRCLEVGFDCHLLKPADPHEVRAALEAERHCRT
jgi:two-component system CheB/CheR fusion protein